MAFRDRNEERAYRAKWRAQNRATQRAYTRKWKYGISPDEYARMFEEQAGACAICGTLDPAPWDDLVVDHDHGTGTIRGLLCHACNAGLGKFRDDPALLWEAWWYLEERPHASDGWRRPPRETVPARPLIAIGDPTLF